MINELAFATLQKFLFVLGAFDPEMKRILKILQELGLKIGCNIVLATKDGKPVLPGEAYKADPILLLEGITCVVFIECRCPEQSFPEGVFTKHLDHHSERDPGFWAPPERYFEGASLGQLISFLASFGIEVRLTREDHILMVADHCPRAGLQGKCATITAQEVFNRKVLDIAIETNTTIQEVEEQIANYLELLQTAKTILLGEYRVVDMTYIELMQGYSLDYLTFQLAVLLLAAQYGEFPVLFFHRDSEESSLKLLLNGGAPHHITYFKCVWALDKGLSWVYGSELRGYAGGSLPNP